MNDQNITFWVYPLGEGEVTFRFEWYSLLYQCVVTEFGGGFGGGSPTKFSKYFHVPANEWTEISINMTTKTLDLHWNIYVDSEGEPTPFYLDEMRFKEIDL